MGKRHQEHENHERWVISYADMITLLFALFVVLYAMGIEKLKNDTARSLAFAFHIAGEGRTQDEGIFDRGKGDGDMLDAVPLVNAQDKGMREFLSDTLPQDFEDVTGKSLEIRPSDDQIRLRTQLLAFFPPGQARLRPEVIPWLKRVMERAHTFASLITVRVEAPRVVIGSQQNNTARYSNELVLARLSTLQTMLALMGASEHAIMLEFLYVDRPGPTATWEERATIAISFSNKIERSDAVPPAAR
jgi:hypothetical protein